MEGRGRFRASRTTFWWVWVEEEAAGARASTASSGGGARATAAGWLRWRLGEEEGSVSCAGPRWSLLGGQRGRRRAAVAAPRRRQACRGCGWSGGGVLERGSEEKAKERGEWVAGVFVVLLRERRKRRALSWPGHGDGEVAAGGRFWARGTERRALARGKRALETVGHDAWVPAQAGGGREGGPARRARSRPGPEILVAWSETKIRGPITIILLSSKYVYVLLRLKINT